jgi:hypothetical protein
MTQSLNLLKHGNGLEQVLEVYKEHAWRILRNQRITGLTPAQRKGYAYYRAAIQTVQALIDAPKPVWVDLKFAKSIRL